MEFDDDDLQRLYEDPDFHVPRLGANVVRAYRKRMQFLIDAIDERDIRAWKSLHYEKLKGDRAGQHSIQLVDQWRLILRWKVPTKPPGRRASGVVSPASIKEQGGQVEQPSLVVVEITDYH